MIDATLRTNKSKIAFQILNRLTIIHPIKRDGGICKCFIDEEENSIKFGNEIVLKNCIQVHSKLSLITTIYNIDYSKCYKLSIISEKDFCYMRKHLSTNKAITFDCFTEQWFLKSNRFDILSDLWTPACIAKMPLYGEARLIPLTKVYPNISNKAGFRPIFVLIVHHVLIVRPKISEEI